MVSVSRYAACYIEEVDLPGCEAARCPKSEQGHARRGGRRKGGRPSGSRNKELGRRGEDAAAWYLLCRGYEILERNWKCFVGEADLIVRDGCCLVFVEVKTRRNVEKGFPAEAVDAAKRDKYEKIALAYLAEYPYVDIPVRFDVISIVVIAPDRAFVRHHVGAFSAA